jgi:hypothetical protein
MDTIKVILRSVRPEKSFSSRYEQWKRALIKSSGAQAADSGLFNASEYTNDAFVSLKRASATSTKIAVIDFQR